jgi:hypothetical protein
MQAARCVVTNLTFFFLMLSLWLGSVSSTMAQDWSWLFSPNQSLSRFATCYFVGDGEAIAAVGADNVYVQSLDGARSVVFHPLDFSRIQDRPRLFAFPSQTLLVGGSALDQSTFGLYRIESESGEWSYTLCDLDGERFNAGIAAGDASVLDNTSMRLNNTFSFNDGRTWFNIQRPPQSELSMSTTRKIAHQGVYVHSIEPKKWFRVDTNVRQYVPDDELDADVCHIALLPSAAAMAIRCIAGDETELVTRNSVAQDWQTVSPFVTESGVLVDPKRSVYQKGDRLFAVENGVALFLLDSGRAVEFDGVNTRLRLLGDSLIRGNLTPVISFRPNSPDVIRAVYQDGTGLESIYTTLDISTKTGGVFVREGLRHQPVDIRSSGYLSTGPYFTSFASNITRPAIRLLEAPTIAREQVYLPVMLTCGNTPITVSRLGEVFVLDSLDQLPYLHKVSPQNRTTGTSLQLLTRRVSFSVFDDTTCIRPGLTPSRISVLGGMERFPSASSVLTQSANVTCSAIDGMNRLAVAGSAIARLTGSVWDTIPFPERFKESSVLISSLTFIGTDTIVAAGRGYVIGSSADGGEFQSRSGGIVASFDGGQQWSSVELPRNEQWVENLVMGPDRALYCWATSMVFDAAFTGPSNPLGGYAVARLYRSTDVGATWAELFIDGSDDNEPRQAIDHQWAISFARDNRMAISTPSAVYVADGIGTPFREVLDLPFTAATFGGCALASDGTLWVAGSRGLHRRSPWVTSVRHEHNPQVSFVVAPNPANDVVTFRLRFADSGGDLPDVIHLTSLDGSVSLRVPRKDGEYETSTSMLAPGAYIARCSVGTAVASTIVMIVR